MHKAKIEKIIITTAEKMGRGQKIFTFSFGLFALIAELNENLLLEFVELAFYFCLNDNFVKTI